MSAEGNGDSRTARWVAPLVAVGTFFVIAGSIGIALYFYFTGEFLHRDRQPERGPLVVEVRSAEGPLPGAWVIVESSTDRRVLDGYQKTVGLSAILQTDADGRLSIPPRINRHANLDMLCWAPGHATGAFRRFQRGSANKQDHLIERGSVDPSRPLPPGAVATLRLAPDTSGAGRTRIERRLQVIDADRLHDASATVERLGEALADAARAYPTRAR